ncbi:uncharacterized protein LOC105698269 [Orussus abietinus]|uniref:uncharacterized protein LOC105698269 n=1 Tax=Orussus abietinus TaxID=222816 RepID=UPI0006268236|nr:uncharacterized protein LOC105698269 [Orussus abietinus]XP_012277780.1 uncharacterized protein LOC105698269 [Orussus abietinus]
MVRVKNRYITIEIIPNSNADKSLALKTTALHNAIQQKVQQMYGDYGQAAIKAGFNAKYSNVHTKIALIKVRHGPHKFVVNSIPQITDIGGRFVSVKILYIGATLKHCFLFIKRFQLKKLEYMWESLKSETDKKRMEDALMSMTPAMKDFK